MSSGPHEVRLPLSILLLALGAGLLAALPPLHEMDLAQHLATGEWIVRNGRVPFTEPFAWTREGQPYFAYSWLAQVSYFTLLDIFGPVALHLFAGVTAAAAAAAAYWAVTQLGFRPFSSAAVAVLHVCLLYGVAPTLRPQQLLFVAVPLAWGSAARIARHGISARRLVVLAAAGALAANTHLFFPITAIPVAWHGLIDGRIRVWAPAAAALLAGWLLTPYALAWPDVFALNFGHNVLLGRPPSVLEFHPGVDYALRRPAALFVALALLATPWLQRSAADMPRSRIVTGVFWTAGLVLFAFAGRLIVFWWALALPAVAHLAEAAEGLVQRVPLRVRSAAMAGGAAIILVAAAPPVRPVFWAFEGSTTDRMLPRAAEDPALWLPSWLLCHTREGARGRIVTEFNYGSELTWRLPGYSPSIDGRTIFPDTIARDFALDMYGRRRVFSTTWRTADLALVDRSFWLAPVLDADPDWLLLAEGRRTSRGTLGALWARRDWWEEWGTSAAVPVLGIFPADPRGFCSTDADRQVLSPAHDRP